MKVTFYGAQGSIATPLTLAEYQDKIKRILHTYATSDIKDVDQFFNSLPPRLSYISGGNTSCAALESDGEEMIILDAGSGFRELGRTLQEKSGQTYHLFFSHFHLDHICGIPFFKPMYNPSNKIIFYSPFKNMEELLSSQQNEGFFPLPFEKLPAQKEFVILDPRQEISLGSYQIRPVILNHPGNCFGYTFIKGNKKLGYATDTEFTPEGMEEQELYYKACYESCDLLIMDAQYSMREIFGKFSWGHTSSITAVNLALDWRVKKLVLFHFDPEYTDDDLAHIVHDAVIHKNNVYNKRNLEIRLAIEGTYIEI